jgi:hypothetical protein
VVQAFEIGEAQRFEFIQAELDCFQSVAGDAGGLERVGRRLGSDKAAFVGAWHLGSFLRIAHNEHMLITSACQGSCLRLVAGGRRTSEFAARFGRTHKSRIRCRSGGAR